MQTITEQIDYADGLNVECFMLRNRSLDKLLTPAETAYWKSLGKYHSTLASSFIRLAIIISKEKTAPPEVESILDAILKAKSVVGINYVNTTKERLGLPLMSLPEDNEP